MKQRIYPILVAISLAMTMTGCSTVGQVKDDLNDLSEYREQATPVEREMATGLLAAGFSELLADRVVRRDPQDAPQAVATIQRLQAIVASSRETVDSKVWGPVIEADARRRIILALEEVSQKLISQALTGDVPVRGILDKLNKTPAVAKSIRSALHRFRSGQLSKNDIRQAIDSRLAYNLQRVQSIMSAQ